MKLPTNSQGMALFSISLNLSLSWGFQAEYKKKFETLDGEAASSIVA